MNRATITRDARLADPGAGGLRPEAPARPTTPGPGGDLEAEVLALRRELTTLRGLRQRDQATARGLCISLQELRRGALALRADNEELRRALHAARAGRSR